MIETLYLLFEVLIWGGTIVFVVYWLWSMLRASRPRKRTNEEQAELESLRAALNAVRQRPGGRSQR